MVRMSLSFQVVVPTISVPWARGFSVFLRYRMAALTLRMALTLGSFVFLGLLPRCLGYPDTSFLGFLVRSTALLGTCVGMRVMSMPKYCGPMACGWGCPPH